MENHRNIKVCRPFSFPDGREHNIGAGGGGSGGVGGGGDGGGSDGGGGGGLGFLQG